MECRCECGDGLSVPCCMAQDIGSTSPTVSRAASHKSQGSENGFFLYGSQISRFVNNYSPVYDVPPKAVTLTSERYLDQHLSKVLEEDRLGMLKHHRTTDKKKKRIPCP